MTKAVTIQIRIQEHLIKKKKDKQIKWVLRVEALSRIGSLPHK